MIDAPRSNRSTTTVWPDRWLGDAAVRRGIPGAERLGQLGGTATAWDALLAAGVSEGDVLALACLVSATKPADLARVGPADSMLMPQTIAEKFGVVPVRTDGLTIVVAASNPLCSTLERDLAFATGRRIHVCTASPAAIAAAHARVYRPHTVAPEPQPRNTPNGLRAQDGSHVQPPRHTLSIPALPVRDLTPEDPDAVRSAIAALADQVFADALREDASDVHFEPKEDGLLVRFRVDGALYDSRRVPAEQSAQLIRRLKVVANMDIADSLRPQDGRASISYEGRNVDMRVSTLPLGGALEKVVVRILDSRMAARELDVVGYTPRELMRVKRMLELPEGLVIVTGPTGSGKTSTLYAAVRHVHRADLNVVTVEDPIEYRIDGINQVQVNERARMTFAASLRSILRQDPDVVLIGEMRDAETASIAVKASITGHLVLSTLHASDALSTLDRLYGMEIDTSALAAALKGIIGQRLVRRLCHHCSVSVTLSELPSHQQQLLLGRRTELLRRPVGCPTCRGTGYHGRTIVAELFIITPALQRAIARRADIGELSELATECGAVSMWESGLERVLDGTTSLYELLDNVAAPLLPEEEAGSQADVDELLAELLARNTNPPAPPRVPLPELPDIAVPDTESDFLRYLGIPADADPAEQSASAPLELCDTLGLAEPEPVLAVMPSPPSRGAARAIAAPTAPGAPAGLRVLVVDDCTPDRRRLFDALAGEGLRVLEAGDGESALAYARRLRPDVIVTEVALPKMDAMALLQALRGEGITARVIVYTRQPDAELAAWLMELGAEEVLPRSTEPRVLAASVRGRMVSVA